DVTPILPTVSTHSGAHSIASDTLSLHDALPISLIRALAASTLPVRATVIRAVSPSSLVVSALAPAFSSARSISASPRIAASWMRSEEHTSELQSRENLVCRLLLEKKKRNTILNE